MINVSNNDIDEIYRRLSALEKVVYVNVGVNTMILALLSGGVL